jgi:hypothetical protein
MFKRIALALFLLPLAARANHGNRMLTCRENGTSYAIITRFGLIPGTELSLVITGANRTKLDSRIDSATRTEDRTRVLVNVTTLDAQGKITPESGRAALVFHVKNRDDSTLETTGTAEIHVTKFPPLSPNNPLLERPNHELTGCGGSL